MVVSVKFAVVNLPKVPPLGVLGPEVPDEVVALKLLAETVTKEGAEVDTGAELVVLVELWLEEPADEVLNAVMVSKDTVGFFILPSFTCNTENSATS